MNTAEYRSYPQYYKLIWLAPLLPLIWMTDATAILWLGSTALALIFIKPSRKPTFSFVYRNIFVSILIGITAGSAMFFLVDPIVEPLAERMTGQKIDLSQLDGLEGDAGSYMEWLIVGLGFGGIVEEICFRGFFIGWGSALFGRKWAIPLVLITSLVFGYGHWWQGPAGAITTGVGSIIFGLVYVSCGNKLLPAIVTHMTSNFLAITAIYLYGF